MVPCFFYYEHYTRTDEKLAGGFKGIYTRKEIDR